MRGTMVADGAGRTEQPLRPARASDAPISVRNCRRLSAFGPERRLLGKFFAHQLLKGLAVGQFFQARQYFLPRRRCALPDGPGCKRLSTQSSG